MPEHVGVYMANTCLLPCASQRFPDIYDRDDDSRAIAVVRPLDADTAMTGLALWPRSTVSNSLNIERTVVCMGNTLKSEFLEVRMVFSFSLKSMSAHVIR